MCGVQKDSPSWFNLMRRLSGMNSCTSPGSRMGMLMNKVVGSSNASSHLYAFLFLIEEHNKAWQNSLVLEICWVIKSC